MEKKIPSLSVTIDRPISFVGSLYELLAKLQADRRKKVMPQIISDVQTAFLANRSILDGILITNEIIHGWKNRRKGGVILKLDFEKAYDSLNWIFLIHKM